jgi:rRNA maturation RNase YbeY
MEEKFIPGDLNFVITNDERLKEINIEFLKHNYFTDVIAFNYSENNRINGEIYVSLETVKRNAVVYKVSLRMELLRVMIHGTLHLCGYNDKTENERNVMKLIEDRWIIRSKEM